MSLPYLDHVRADAAALAAAGRRGLDAQCPSCPDWTVLDLVHHTGMIHRWVVELVRTRASARIQRRDLPQPPADPAETVDWFEANTAELLAVLADVDPDMPVWNWTVDKPHVAGFWLRRMAHETSIHRWDGEHAHGVATPVDTALAVDGIDELMDAVLPTMAADNPGASLGGSLHAHATDAEGEWLVTVDDSRVALRREHGKGDAAVRGPASDLLLYLYARAKPERVERFGDEAVLANWFEVSRFG